MKWNAFTRIEEGIERTRRLLFPIKLKYWMKLGFVSMLSIGSKTGSGGNGFNSGFPSRDNKFTGKAISSLDKIGNVGIGLLILIGLILGLIYSFISSVFSFIFIDALIKKDYKIKKSWKENVGKGSSLFGFIILTGAIFLLISGIIFLPIILRIVNMGFEGAFAGLSLFGILKIILPSVLLFIVWVILYCVFMTFVFDFCLPDMYKNKVSMTMALKRTFENIWKYKAESFVYIIAKIVLGIAAAILSFVVIVVVGLVFLLIGLIIFVPLYYISVIAMVLILIPYIVLFVYTFNVVILPLSSFMKYFSLICYEKLFTTKIL